MTTFAQKLLQWFDQHGRKNLPWQQQKTPYRVWISEVMLQQTQVTTVIPYFKRFIERFPTIEILASTKEDEVLHLWTGLGYYSRARNLYKTAKIITEQYAGKFPDTLEALQQLPGIGQSTAGAILAIAFEKPATILDGNVKRVLTRFHALTDTPNKNLETLWQLAEKYTPKQRIADYTQAIMDLGATICIRGKPLCTQCPLHKKCLALQQNIAHTLPITNKRKQLPVRQSTFLILLDANNNILLMQRPPNGVWGNLWSLPEITGHVTVDDIKRECKKRFNLTTQDIHPTAIFRHTFSHFHLDIYPVIIQSKKMTAKIMDNSNQIWYNQNQPQKIGLPLPVKKLLETLPNATRDPLR